MSGFGGMSPGSLVTAIVSVVGVVGGTIFELWRRAKGGGKKSPEDVAERISTAYSRLLEDVQAQCSALERRCSHLTSEAAALHKVCADLQIQCTNLTREGAKMRLDHATRCKVFIDRVVTLEGQIIAAGLTPAAPSPEFLAANQPEG